MGATGEDTKVHAGSLRLALPPAMKATAAVEVGAAHQRFTDDQHDVVLHISTGRRGADSQGLLHHLDEIMALLQTRGPSVDKLRARRRRVGQRPGEEVALRILQGTSARTICLWASTDTGERSAAEADRVVIQLSSSEPGFTTWDCILDTADGSVTQEREP